jgi:hypothetical protein
MTKIIKVSDNFYNFLKRLHEEFNREVSLKYYKKKMSLVDFTDFIVKFNLLSIDYSKILLAPIKKGKKSKKIKIEDFIPI